MGNHEEQCAFRRFLNDFQQFVGRLHLQFLRQPYHHSPISVRIRRKRKFVQDNLRIQDRNNGRFLVNAERLVQFILHEERVAHEKFTPLLYIGERRRFFTRLVLGCSRKDEMHIRINQLGNLVACRACSAGILFPTMLAVKILHECHDQRQCPAALILVKHHSVRNAARDGHSDQRCLHFSISYDIRKPHDFLSAVNSAISPSISTSCIFPKGLNAILALSTYS